MNDVVLSSGLSADPSAPDTGIEDRRNGDPARSLSDAPRTGASAVFANAELVLPDRVLRGRVIVEDGRIAAIEEGGHVPCGALDCEGDYLMPGLVELHTDNLERHIEPRPGVDWPH